jgi:4-hydroxy-3-polyprenylbenzoate decarboxylase
MAYRSLRAALLDLEQHKQLLRIKTPLSPDLEMAEVHRRIFEAKGPAIWFEKVIGSPFSAASNLYGTYERTDFLFRKTMPRVQKIIELKADFSNFFKNPTRYWNAPFIALNGLPTRSWFSPPVKYGQTTIDKLPLIKSWPMDGGAFITMPQVCSLAPKERNVMKSNIGMYRIQLSGNEYKLNEEIGLHYQLHRGIGVHHTAYNETDEEFKVSVFVGGAPSHPFAAIMPLPEGLSELTFAGLLNDRRFRYAWEDNWLLSSEADFCILGTVDKTRKLPEGPFGDHLGYYSLSHDFPVMKVHKVYHRKDAIWHFSVVGRPPQEDSSFGYLIHQLVKKLTASEFPGLKQVHAVDAAGVHPLLLAVGSERYMPFRTRQPEEILTIANRLLGSGQTSLAKFLIIAADGDDKNLDCHNIPDFFNHVLTRVDWKRDLHFHTKTTIDTLDYSGQGWNAGSKLIIACCGQPLRTLTDNLPIGFNLPSFCKEVSFIQKGILAISASKFENYKQADVEMLQLCECLEGLDLKQLPLIVVCDDAHFLSATTNNFIWATFTRANPSHDIYGVGSTIEFKHWGCKDSLIIDARIKPHHAPELVTDKATVLKVDKLFSKGGELYGKI